MLSKWGQRFSPLSLFAAGEQGGWWDPSDFSTMFQDSAGTTPVTAVGQPVGKILDKSGRANHASQGTAASRPTLQQDASGYFYLSFDGVDDSLVTASIPLGSAGPALTMFAGIRKDSDAAAGVVMELGSGRHAMFAPAAAGVANLSFRTFGTVSNTVTTNAAYAAPLLAVLSCLADNSQAVASQVQPRINGAVPTVTGASDAGNVNLTAQALSFGIRVGGTLPLVGRIYQAILRGATSSAGQIAQGERFVGSKMGIVL